MALAFGHGAEMAQHQGAYGAYYIHHAAGHHDAAINAGTANGGDVGDETRAGDWIANLVKSD